MMSDELKAGAAIGLLLRASYAPARMATLIQQCTYTTDDQKFRRAMQILDSLTEIMDEHAPDPGWWREYFTLSGQHMVLTDEGWEPGDIERDPEVEIHDEVNAPATFTEPTT